MKKLDLKLLDKIKKRLGKEYEIVVEWDELGDNHKWWLYQKFISRAKEPIMTSKEYTVDELVEFSKSVVPVNNTLYNSKFSRTFVIGLFFFVLLNLFILHNGETSLFLLGLTLSTAFYLFLDRMMELKKDYYMWYLAVLIYRANKKEVKNDTNSRKRGRPRKRIQEDKIQNRQQ